MSSVERSPCPAQGHCRCRAPSDTPTPPTGSPNPGEGDRAASAAQGLHAGPAARARARIWLFAACLHHHAGDIPECHPDSGPSSLPTDPTVSCRAPVPAGKGTQSQQKKRGSNPLTGPWLYSSQYNIFLPAAPPAHLQGQPRAAPGLQRFTSAEMQVHKIFTQPRFQGALFSSFPISHEQDASPPPPLQQGQTLRGC